MTDYELAIANNVQWDIHYLKLIKFYSFFEAYHCAKIYPVQIIFKLIANNQKRIFFYLQTLKNVQFDLSKMSKTCLERKIDLDDTTKNIMYEILSAWSSQKWQR